MKKVFLLSCLVGLLMLANAQDTSGFYIKGKIVELKSNDIVPFVTITLGQEAKDTILSVAQSNEEGYFEFLNLLPKEYVLKFSSDGFQNSTQKVKLIQNTDLQDIKLETVAVSELKEVVIVSEKEQAKLAIDKRVFEVDKNLNAVGGTAENLLKNIPSVTIDSDGNATMRNANATVYVDGKPTQLTLAQIPANQIESIEIISNPSAKYEAAAANGIINLVLKKTKKQGFNGSIAAGIGTNNRYNTTINLEYAKNKWSFMGMYNMVTSNAPLTGYTRRTVFDSLKNANSYYRQDTKNQFLNLNQNARVAVDYKANSKNTISLAGNYVFGLYNNNTELDYKSLMADYQILNYGSRKTTPDNQFYNLGVELGWNKSFSKKGKSLILVSSFTRNNMSNKGEWYTTSYDSTNTLISNYPENNTIKGNTLGNQFLGQLDYTVPFNDSTKIELGARTFTNDRDQKYLFYQKLASDSNYRLLGNYSQNAHITETVNALYVMYSTRLKHKLDVQAGLRFEQSGMYGKSYLESPSSSFGYEFPSNSLKNTLRSFFPSLALLKPLNSNTEIGFNFTRKIGRPNWRHVFVGILNNDKQNITRGNPAIQPQFINTAEFNFNKHWKKFDWLATTYFTLEENSIKPLAQRSSTDSSVLVTTFVNANYEVRTGVDNTLSFNLLKNLKVMANYNGFYVNVNSANYNNSLWAYIAKLNVTYKLPKNISIQLNGNYSSKIPLLQGYRGALTTVDVSLKKSFLNNKANVVLQGNDLFNTGRFLIIYDQPNMYQKLMFRREIRYFKITFQYNFGKKESPDSKKKPKKSSSGSEIDLGM